MLFYWSIVDLLVSALKQSDSVIQTYVTFQILFHCRWSQDTEHTVGLPCLSILFVIVQALSHIQLFATMGTAAHQAALSFTVSQSFLKLMPIESTLYVLTNSFVSANPELPIHPSPTLLPCGNHQSVLYACESVPDSWISLFMSYFRFCKYYK